MIKEIHQYVSTIARRDAIGEYAFVLKKAFREMGYASEIFYDSCTEEVYGETIPFSEYKRFSTPDNLFIIHYGIKLPYLDALTALRDKRVLVYHNITPGKYFKIFAPWMVGTCSDSRLEVSDLKNYVSAAVGDSDYNANELREMGYRNVRTIPLSVDFSKYEIEPDPAVLALYPNKSWANWLFVGRLSPNKKQEDLIRNFYYYQKYFNDHSRLFLVGHGAGMNAYVKYLKKFATHLGVRNIIFTGSVSQAKLSAYYQTADLFMTMSEHEGFCVPLLEAFYYKVPIIAYDSSAVSETLGESGVLIKDKKAIEIAALADYIIRDSNIKSDIIKLQSERLKSFRKEFILKKWKDFIESLQPQNLSVPRLESNNIIKSSPNSKFLKNKVSFSKKDKNNKSKLWQLKADSENSSDFKNLQEFSDTQIDVQAIVDSIKIEAYLDDFDGFEKRLRQIRERHNFLNLPNLADEYSSFLDIWPLRPLAKFGTRVFRKLYVLHSRNQREPINQLLDEIKILYVALRHLRKKSVSQQKKHHDRKS